MDTDKTIRRALIAAKSIASSIGVGARPGFAAGGDTGAGAQTGVFDEPKERRLNSLGMYSAAAEAARALPQKMGTAQQMVASLKGVKPDELNNAKVFSRWQPNDKISKEELAQHLEDSSPPIDKRQLSGDSSRFHQYSTKGGENYKETLLGYNVYGGPDDGLRYNSPHWPGSPNTLVHYRTSDRPNVGPIRKPRLPTTDTTVGISRGRHEYQEQHTVLPGWGTVSPGLVAHRAYRSPKDGLVLTHRPSGLSVSRGLDLEGAHALANDLHALTPHWDSMSYEDLMAMPTEFKNRVRDAAFARRMESGNRESAQKEAQSKAGPRALLLDELQSDWAQQGREHGVITPDPISHPLAHSDDPRQRDSDGKKVPSAPYIDSTQKWTDLGLKSVLHEAAIGGHSHLVWTPGDKQTDRYNLSKHIDSLHWVPSVGSDNLGVLHALKDKRNLLGREMRPDEIHKHVGKEVAERLLSQPVSADSGMRSLRGNDLSIGGHGMKGYYDNILPKRILALAREHDPEAKISPYKSKDKHVNGFPSVEITPRMRKSILAGGFKSFARGGKAVGKAGGGSVVLDPKERAANLGKFMEGSHPETFEDGSPKVLHHGTLSEFSAFGKGSVMAHHGAGIYMTDTPEDAANNYASPHGPDQHAKIQFAEERLMDHPEFEHGPIEADRLRNAARKELGHTNDGFHLPLHVSMQNPVVIGGDNHTKFTYEEPYNEDTEEYGEPSGSLVNLIGGVQKTAAEMGLSKRDEDALISALHEHALDDGGIDARGAEELIKLHGHVDDDAGDPGNSEFWRRSLENAGHDGIIDHDVYKKFNRMHNTHPETTHYIAFSPEQVKSAIGNNGRYDRRKKDLTKASGGGCRIWGRSRPN